MIVRIASYHSFKMINAVCFDFRYLHQNLLSKLENLEPLQHLDTLNVSNNVIDKIENICK